MASNSMNFELHDLPRTLWYRRRIFLPTVVLVTLASAIIALLLPNIYEATSTIVLEQKPIAESSLGSTFTPDIDQRLRILQTVLMSEYLLQKVIAHLKLIPNMYDPLAVQEKIDELRKGITVRIKGTDSLQISYEGTDRQMVMRITNELANFFIEDTLRYMKEFMEGTTTFLKEGLTATENELQTQEHKMLAFKGQHLKELPDQVDANQRALDRLLARLDGVERSIRDVKGILASAKRDLVEFEWYPQHPKYQSLKKQADQYEREMQGLNADRAHLLEKIKEYEARLDRAPEREQTWILLTRGYDVLKDRYRTLMNKHLDAQLSLKLQQFQKEAKFRVLDPASLPLIPIRPNRYLIVAIGFIAGLALGFGGVLLAEMGNRSLRTHTDLPIPLRPPLLACIPLFGELPGQRAIAALPGNAEVATQPHPRRWSLSKWYGETKTPRADAHLRDNGSHVDPAVIMLSAPISVLAEQYRHLRTSIRFRTHDGNSKVLVVTSALPGEGKSVTAANLAVAMAYEGNHKILLIDAELRKPGIHRLLGLKLQPGLADVLSHGCPLVLALQQGPVDDLMVMSAGEAPGIPADLISPRGMTSLLSKLRTQFTCIILDSPPILPVADACVLASCADAAVMVARAGVTRGDAFTDALERLGSDKALGVVLNAVDRRFPRFRFYHYYGYYGDGHSERKLGGDGEEGQDGAQALHLLHGGGL